MSDIVERLSALAFPAGFQASSPERETCLDALNEIKRLRNEIDRLREGVKVQANAVKMLDRCRDTEVARLRETHRQADIAANTLDSEREANALLTAENERMREALTTVLEWHGYGLPDETTKIIRAALAEQEKK